MESALWRAAEVLRDRLDARGVRDLLLTLLTLRHLGAAEGVPAAARWDSLRAGSIQDALDAVVAWRPTLAFPDLPAVPAARLAAVMDVVGELPASAEDDVVGEAYMRLLGAFARAEGRRGGQYYTPPSVAGLLMALVQPVAGRAVYDPCCGSGGLLVAAASAGASQLVGQEMNPSTWRLAHLAAAVHDLELDLGMEPADTLGRDLHAGRHFDRIVANPPFNLARWGAAHAAEDPRFVHGVPSDNNANLAWIQHVLHHLSPAGRAAVILANGSLSGRDGTGLRTSLVRSGRVAAVVALPDLLFLTTPIPACVWVLRGSPGSHITFVDARRLGEKVERAWRALSPEDVARITEAVHEAREEPGFSRAMDIASVDHELVPGRYVGAPPRSEDAEDLELLVAEWRAARDRAQQLDDALEATLANLSSGMLE